MSRPRRIPLLLLSLLLTGSLLVPGPVSAVVFTLGAVAFPVALIALGARRGGQAGPGGGLDRRLAGALMALLVILELSAGAVLVLSGGREEGGAALSGLPWAAVVQIVGLWLLPLPVVALAYALTFDRSGVRPDDLAALRRRFGSQAGDDRGEG